MYRESDLMTCLFGLAGWRQNENPDYPELSPGLTGSLTGLYFQDVHPLVSIENLDQALKNYDEFNYPVYAEHGVYAVGDRVRYQTDGKVYEATAVIADAPAILAPGSWQEVNLFSQKIDALTRSSINKVASLMFTGKKLDGVAKSIFESVQLFGGLGDIMQKEMKQGRFVGFEIKMRGPSDVTTFIQRIGTQFSGVNPNFKLYLFASGQSEPVQVIDLALTKANAFQWTKPTDSVQLRSLSAQLFPSSTYYLGYYEDDLIGQAINAPYDFGSLPCGTCNNNLALYGQWSRFMDVTPFYVSAGYLQDIKPSDPGGPLLWNISANQYTYQKNYGLNLDITTACDVTDFLCRERRLFTDAITLQVAVDVLNELAFSTRNNVITQQVRDIAAAALQDEEKTPGLKTRLKNSIDAISFDLSSLSDVCFPCNNKNGLSWGSW